MRNARPAVELQGLSKDYAGEKALRELSLVIPEGALFGLIGADGAGKTTLLSILATLRDADAGTVRVLGKNPATDFNELRHRLGYMPQRFSLYADLSVEENLRFFASLFGLTPEQGRERMDKLLQFAGLADFRRRRAGALSGGMKQKLALSCILLHEPELLLLDEPTVGVDPVARRDFWRLLRTLRDEGRTIIVSTPYMDEAEMCAALALLHQGRLLAQGSPASLTERFPHPLYALEAESPLRWAMNQARPQGFKSIYPMGGKLHAVAEGIDPQADVSALKAQWDGEVSAQAVKPGIEDVFLGLLTGTIPPEVYSADLGNRPEAG